MIDWKTAGVGHGGDRSQLAHPAATDHRTRFGEIAAAAQREQLTYFGFLAELVMAECDDPVDRLTYKGQIIETGTSSYLAHARANRNAP